MSSVKRNTKSSVTFLEMRYGDMAKPSYLRLCNAVSPKTFKGKKFFSEPSMGIEIPKQTGTIDTKPTRIQLPVNRGVNKAVDEILMRMSGLRPFPITKMRIFEVLTTSEPDDQEIVHLDEGTLESSKRNPRGLSGLVELEFKSEKASLGEIALGIPLNPDCGWAMGGNGCYLDTTQFFDPSTYWPNSFKQIRRAYVEMRSFYSGPLVRSREVDIKMSQTQHPGASQNTITFQPQGWWLGSFLEKDGLSLSIVDWQFIVTAGIGTHTFVLSDIPPREWFYDASEDNFLTLILGCSKSPQACDDRGNSINFGGGGLGIPAYNPVVEEDSR